MIELTDCLTKEERLRLAIIEVRRSELSHSQFDETDFFNPHDIVEDGDNYRAWERERGAKRLERQERVRSESKILDEQRMDILMTALARVEKEATDE